MITIKLARCAEIQSIRMRDLAAVADVLCIPGEDRGATKVKIREAIRGVQPANDTDPITLEDVDAIDVALLIGWRQAGRTYVCRIDSLHAMFRSGNVTNPFAVDHASGIQRAADPDGFEATYSLDRVPMLRQRVEAAFASLPPPPAGGGDDIPDAVRVRFDIIECAPDMYISHIVQFFEAAPPAAVLKVLELALFALILSYRSALAHEEITEDSVATLGVLTQLHVGLREARGGSDGLTTAHEVLALWKAVLEQNVMNAVMDYVGKAVAEFNSMV